MPLQTVRRSLPALSLAALVVLPACERVQGSVPASSVADGAPPHEIELENPYYQVWPAGVPTPWSWGKLPEGRVWGSTSAVHVDKDGTSMWVFDRCGTNHSNCLQALDVDPIMKFDSDGNLLLAFGAGMFVNPHGIHVDRDGNIWATDAGGPNARSLEEIPASRDIGHRAVKFSPTGEVLLIIGTGGQPGDPPNHLTAPTGLATASNGDIFITEAHSGPVNRVSKFRADGTFIKSWGSAGSGPGEFDLPHDISIDSQDRIFVADRSNYRIQIFDQEGNYIDSWKQFGRPSGLYISPDDALYVADSHSWGDEPRKDNEPYRKGIRIGSARTGEVKYYLPDLEVMTRANSGGEGVGADAAGNVYGAIVRRLGVEKHVLPAN